MDDICTAGNDGYEAQYKQSSGNCMPVVNIMNADVTAEKQKCVNRTFNVVECDPDANNQKWYIDGDMIRNYDNISQCIQSSPHGYGNIPSLNNCNSANISQKWIMPSGANNNTLKDRNGLGFRNYNGAGTIYNYYNTGSTYPNHNHMNDRWVLKRPIPDGSRGKILEAHTKLEQNWNL